METSEIIREKIFGLVDKSGISDAEFANGISVSRFVVSHWRRKISTSYIKYLKNIAAYFNVTVDYLTGNEPDAEYDNILTGIKSRAELKKLFQVSMNASKEDVENAIKIIEALKKE